MDLEDLRAEIADIDMEILALMKKRAGAARKVGEIKAREGAAIRNVPVEGHVIGRYRRFAEANGLDPGCAEEVARTLIRESVEIQCAIPRPGSAARKVAVVGGAGKMGKWFADLLSSSGNDVTVVDPASGNGLSLDSTADADAVIVSVPIAATGAVLKELDVICRPDALVFDISSLKSPFTDVLRDMASRRPVCSLHPMFGPSAGSMYGRNLIACDCGNADAVDRALELIGDRGADIRRMDVSVHDEYMSYVLGLSHAVNIAFFTVLERSGFGFKDMLSVSSTTFRKNLETNESVAVEDPLLYYQIQHLNDSRDALWSAFTCAVEDLKEASLDPSPKRFVSIMNSGREYFEGTACHGRGT